MLLMLVIVLLTGCGSSESMSNGPPELIVPQEVDSEIITNPQEPQSGELTLIRVRLIDEQKPRDGMRIELRDNARETRLYDAAEIEQDGQLYYEIEAIFENSGENLITLHFNLGSVHIMTSHTVEVK